MTGTIRLLCDIIKCYLNKTEPDFQFNEAQLSEVSRLARMHDVEHLVGTVLSSRNSSVSEALFRSQMIAVMRAEQQSYERARIYEQFENAKIDYIPLKGSVIREFYPEPWHRTSCDIDVLVREHDLNRATNILVNHLGYELQKKSNRDVSLMASDNVHLELHYDFEEENVNVSEIWEWSYSDNEACLHKMTAEVFIFCHLAHMAKHFKSGGCGFRGFIDLWIIEYNMPYNRDELWRMLEQKGLRRFADVAFELVDCWFGDREETPLVSRITDYILGAGAYGSTENHIAIGRAKKKTKQSYFFSRLFLTREQLKYRYPILERSRFMLPICQVRRWITLVLEGKLRKAKREFEINANLKDSDIEYVEQLIKELEI